MMEWKSKGKLLQGLACRVVKEGMEVEMKLIFLWHRVIKNVAPLLFATVLLLLHQVV